MRRRGWEGAEGMRRGREEERSSGEEGEIRIGGEVEWKRGGRS